MFLYFFDIDDTICDTTDYLKSLLDKKDFMTLSEEEIRIKLTDIFYSTGVENLPVLENSSTSLLRKLLKESPELVYYMTAREGELRSQTEEWLKKNDLWISDEKLITDTYRVKGKTINKIMENKPQEVAFLFDDARENHLEVKDYKNIIMCLPNLINIDISR